MNNINERVANYELNNSIFRVSYGDITKLKVDAIVSSDDNYLSMSGGVSRAILKSGGQEIRKDANKKIPVNIGDVAVTTAGDLLAKYVLHAITIDYTNMVFASEDTIKSATLRCLQLADLLKATTIAFPALGTGSAGFPLQKAAEVMTKTIAEYLLGKTSIELVILSLHLRVDFNENKINLFYERVAAQMSIYNSSKRLISLLSELKDTANSLGFGQSINDTIKKLEVEFKNTNKELKTTSYDLEQSDELKSRNGLEEASQDAVKMTNELRSAEKLTMSEDSQKLEADILNTKMTGLQTVLNIKISHLNRYEIEKAKYGGIGVPPRLDTAIDELTFDITKLEEQLRTIKLELFNIRQ